MTEGSVFATARDNPALARAIDQILRDQWRDGTVQKAYDSVFGDVDYLGLPLTHPPAPTTTSWATGKREFARPRSRPSPRSPRSPGSLTVGIVADGPLLKLEGDKFTGPEAAILESAAKSLGLTLKPVRVTDEAGAL